MTSKLYVDTQVALTAKLASANTFTGLQTIVGDLSVDGVINQTGASWSLGGFSNGDIIALAYNMGENTNYSVKQTPEINWFIDETERTITILKKGKYLVSYLATTANNNTFADVRLRRNDVDVNRAYSHSYSGIRKVSSTTILDLEVNDTLSVYLVNGSMITGQELRYFNGYLIG